MKDEVYVGALFSEDYLAHYGVGHLQGGHSGRYPWGSGERPKQGHPTKIYRRNADKANEIFKTLTDEEKYYLTAEKKPKQYVSKEEYGKDSTNVYSRIEYYADKGASFFDVWCNDNGVGEVSIAVRNDPDFRGKGYSKRAMEAGLKWFEQNKDMQWLVWGVNANNTASRKLAEKYGFHHYKSYDHDKEWITYIKKKRKKKR